MGITMAQHSGIAEIEKDTTATVADTLARETLAAVARFNQAFNDHDAAAVMAAMTDDCIFENTNPAPDGAGDMLVRNRFVPCGTSFLQKIRMLTLSLSRLLSQAIAAW
jgi:ketosteroid isomerase-like protein